MVRENLNLLNTDLSQPMVAFIIGDHARKKVIVEKAQKERVI